MNPPSIIRERDRLYARAGKLTEGEFILDGVPRPPAPSWWTGWRLQRAIRLLRRVLQINPYSWSSWFMIGKAYERLGATEAALDAFNASVKDAKPIYESAKGIINSHQGFDANGKVTDPEKAKETVKAMHEKMQEIKAAMDGTGKALRDAIKAFREANPRPVKTPKP